jgi:hypothetical protein
MTWPGSPSSGLGPLRASASVALVLGLLVAAGCGPGPDGRAGPEGPSSIVAVFLVRSAGADAFVEPALLDRGVIPVDTTAAVRSAIEGLLVLTGEGRGQPVSQVTPDLTSSVPPGIGLLDVRIEDGIVTVDLGGELIAAGGSSLEERTFAQQLAHSALLDDSLTSVRLLVDGVAVTELWGHLDWSEPLRADPSALSPIIIEEPGPATVIVGAGAITVRGQAGVPGGRIVLHLEDGAGAVVAEGQVTATEAAPARGEWNWEVRIPGTGEWVIVARSAGAGAGGVVFETRRLVTLGARG